MRVLGFFVALFMASSAFAIHGEAWTCDINIKAEGYRVGLIFGAQSIDGKGTLNCVSGDETYSHDVYLYIGGFQFGLSNVNIDQVHFSAAGVGLADPRDFYGKYNAGLTAGASLDENGNEYDAVFALKRGGLGFEVGASNTILSRYFDRLPMVDVFAGIKAMRFSDKPID